MFVAIILIITLLLGWLALRLLYGSLRSNNWPRLIAGTALVVFVYLYGAWIFLSAFGKYLFAASALTAIVAGLMRKRHTHRPRTSANTVFYLALSVLLAALDVLYYTGTEGRTEYRDLAFPLKGARYYVFQGGKGLPANVFHYNAHGEVYAMDIVKLDRWGRRCRRIFSTRLEDYYIFGDTIYSPCGGTIRRAVGNNPDNIPPNRVPGISNLNGVLIEGREYLVYLGHMKQNSVFVNAGQQVAIGQPLGLAGNSGMSIEPHLHMQVHKMGTDGRPWYDQPQLFMKFNGKAYLLFDIIEQ